MFFSGREVLMTIQTNSLSQKYIYGISDFTVKLVFSMLFALLMAISANAYIYLPFTPVPVTLQVLTVISSAFML